MSRFALVWLMGCSQDADLPSEPEPDSVPAPDGPGTGFETGPWEEASPPAPADDPRYDGAFARILSPRAKR